MTTFAVSLQHLGALEDFTEPLVITYAEIGARAACDLIV